MIYIRSLIANFFFFGAMLGGCILSPLIALGPRRWSIFWWDKTIMPLSLFFMKIFAGLKVEFRGTQYISKVPALYACKHESSLETYSFTQGVPTTSYVLKKELTYIPFFGWSQHFYGMIPIDRKAGSAAMKTMLKGVKQRMKENRPVIIFPEGTRCRPGSTKGYKSGFLFIAENLNLKIIPVAVNTGLFWTKNSFLRYPGTAVFEFMEPMEFKKGMDKKEFIAELEQRIEDKCAELNAEAAAKYPWVKKNLA